MWKEIISLNLNANEHNSTQLSPERRDRLVNHVRGILLGFNNKY